MSRSLCKIDGCSKPVHGHGWCAAHHRRWYRHGDPLDGRTPEGEPERYYRDVVLTCERGENDPCLIWPFSRPGTGYATLRRDGKMRTVSRLLCREVHGEPPTPDHQAAHSCGRGDHGCVTNGHVFWKTPVENQADKLIHGTHNRGERCGTAKITAELAISIIKLKGKLPQREIAERVGLDQSTVSLIQQRKIWGWLSV